LFLSERLTALFFFIWKAILRRHFSWWVSGSLGIGMSYHRLLTHRGYKTPKLGGILSDLVRDPSLSEGGPIFLGGDSSQFTTNSPTSTGDPHSPRDGSGGRTWDGFRTGDRCITDTTTLRTHVPDLTKDKSHVWLSQVSLHLEHHPGCDLFCDGGLPFLSGGSVRARSS